MDAGDGGQVESRVVHRDPSRRAGRLKRPHRPRRAVWALDHKYLPTQALPPKGPAVTPWLTTIVDDGTRALIGWAISLTPHTGAVLTAIRMTLLYDDPARTVWRGGVPRCQGPRPRVPPVAGEGPGRRRRHGRHLIVFSGKVRAEGRDGMRIGALAQTVLHPAHCPVVTVPEH